MGSTQNPRLNKLRFYKSKKRNSSKVATQKTEVPYLHEGLANNIYRFKYNVDKKCWKCGEEIPSDSWIYHLPSEYYGEDQVTVEPVCSDCTREYVKNADIQGEVVAKLL